MIQLLKRSGVQTAVLAMSVALLAGCGEANKRTASYYLNSVSDSEWTQAEANKIVLHLTRTGAGSGSNRMTVDGLTSGATLTLNALQPYVMEVVMDGRPSAATTTGNNNRRHSMSESVGSLFQGIALKKVVTATAEYEMSYLRDLIMLKPSESTTATCAGTLASPCTDIKVKLYFVPVATGTYSVRCTPHSSSGATSATTTMAYPVSVVGEPGLTVDHEISSQFQTSALAAWAPATAQTDTPTGWHASEVISGKVNFVAQASGLATVTGTLSKDTKSVVRFSKASGVTDQVSIASDLFDNAGITWVGDKYARVVPYGLKSIKMLAGASDSSQASTSTLLKYDGHVDLYVQPKTSGSATIELNSVNNSIAVN